MVLFTWHIKPCRTRLLWIKQQWSKRTVLRTSVSRYWYDTIFISYYIKIYIYIHMFFLVRFDWHSQNLLDQGREGSQPPPIQPRWDVRSLERGHGDLSRLVQIFGQNSSETSGFTGFTVWQCRRQYQCEPTDCVVTGTLPRLFRLRCTPQTIHEYSIVFHSIPHPKCLASCLCMASFKFCFASTDEIWNQTSPDQEVLSKDMDTLDTSSYCLSSMIPCHAQVQEKISLWETFSTTQTRLPKVGPGTVFYDVNPSESKAVCSCQKTPDIARPHVLL